MWFKVDDKLHSHRKAREVRRSHESKQRDVAPFGLWVLAGSWASDSGTTGFVPAEILAEWDDHAVILAERLVSAELWWKTEQDSEPGYGFHDWQDYVPKPEGIEEPSESGRRGNHVRWHLARDQSSPDCEFCAQDRPDIAPDDRPDIPIGIAPNREPVPTRPDPTTRAPDLDFTEWYAAYPRKIGKGAAVKAYRAARKKVDADTLLVAARRQAAHLMLRGAEFCPHPATWLNGERWADEAPRADVVQLLPSGEVDPASLPPVEESWMHRRRT